MRAAKLLNFILFRKGFREDLEIEVEYQSLTIGKYDLAFDGTNFLLLAKQTACLAKEACGIENLPKKELVNLAGTAKSCTPAGVCC